MNLQYTITNNILDNVAEFTKLHERFFLLNEHKYWLDRIKAVTKNESAQSAISLTDNVTGKWILNPTVQNLKKLFNEEDVEKMTQYKQALEYDQSIFESGDIVNNLAEVNQIILHGRIRSSFDFRKKPRSIAQYLYNNGAVNTVDIKIKTDPEDIHKKIRDLFTYYFVNKDFLNPIILSGIMHFNLAEIHPFDDGNGRLCWIVEKQILKDKGVDPGFLLIEDYYRINYEAYFNNLREGTSSGDLTSWLEFYTKGLLFSARQTIEILYALTGGTIDLWTKKFIPLTQREIEVVEILNKLDQASAADIGKELFITRQSANTLVKNLLAKKLLKKIGTNTSVRYQFNFDRQPLLTKLNL